jgi:alpha-N-arabinofuranosidase
MLGADAYINGNVGTGSVQEMADWVEYLTADGGSPLARLRAQNGREKPFKVAYFGIGNELWGCGGNMKPEYYANLYNNYEPSCGRPRAQAENDRRWRRHLVDRRTEQGPEGPHDRHQHPPVHHPDRCLGRQGQDLGFKEGEWISTLAATLKMDQIVKDHVAVLDKNDPKRKSG